jgi:hypothetical protein
MLFATEGSDEGMPYYGVIVVGDLVPELPAE